MCSAACLVCRYRRQRARRNAERLVLSIPDHPLLIFWNRQKGLPDNLWVELLVDSTGVGNTLGWEAVANFAPCPPSMCRARPSDRALKACHQVIRLEDFQLLTLSIDGDSLGCPDSARSAESRQARERKRRAGLFFSLFLLWVYVLNADCYTFLCADGLNCVAKFHRRMRRFYR